MFGISKWGICVRPAFLSAPCVLILVCLTLLGSGGRISASGQEYFVAPDGRATNSGDFSHPLDLSTALSGSSPAKPGDTIWLRGGTYRGTFISHIAGLSGAPIVVRQYPNERATIDSAPSKLTALEVRGSYVTFWGFEIMNSDPSRTSQQTGSWPSDLTRGHGIFSKASHTKFVNLIIHDMQQGIGLWSEAVNAEATGNVIYFNGWQAPDRAHGHGIYTQNQTGRRLLRDNIIFDQFSHGIHAYGSSAAYLDNITLDGNVSFNNGSIGDSLTRDLLYGGGDRAEGMVVENNFTFNGQANLGYGAGCSADAVIRGNFFVGPLQLINCLPQILTGNTVYGNTSRWSPVTGATLPEGNVVSSTRPTEGVNVFVRPNKYEAGRAHIVIYNWDRRPNVSVDLSAAGLAPYAAFDVLDAQNYFGSPVVQGVYAPGTPVGIPMGSLPPRDMPVGNVRRLPPVTAPGFGVFVVVPAGRTPPPPEPEPVATVEMPHINPAGGRFTGSTTVALVTETPEASTHYTLDGTTPTPGSRAYTAPFVLTSSARVRARAFRPGSVDSAVAAANFIEVAPTPPPAVPPTAPGPTAPTTRDYQKPSIAITSPATGSTLRGVVRVTAVASDNVGVAGVRFLINGRPLGAHVLAPPYSMIWDTSTTLNSSYRVLAEAWDAAGNRILAYPATVKVAN